MAASDPTPPAERIPASTIRVHDLIEEPWRGAGHRVLAVEPSVSGKIIHIKTVVEFSTDPLIWIGRPFNHSKRAATLVLIQRPDDPEAVRAPRLIASGGSELARAQPGTVDARVSKGTDSKQRTAQRKLVGTLNRRSMMWFDPDLGFCIWRDKRASVEWGAGIPELSAHFNVLEIPYVVRPEMLNTGGQAKAGFALVVRWNDLPALTRWVPSFQKQIDNARAELASAPSNS